MTLVVAMFLCVLVVTTESYADLDAYINYYTIAQMDIPPTGIYDLPVGWLLLNRVVAATGLSVRSFICIVLVVCVLLSSRFFKRVGCEHNMPWCLFLVFPALVQCVQLRFFLGFSIVLVSFIGIANNEKFSVIRFVAGVFIASLIHSSMLVFLVLSPAGMIGSLGKKKGVFVVIAFAAIVYICVGYVPRIASTIISSSKYERYFVSGLSSTTLSWFVKILAIWVVTVILSYASIRLIVGEGHNKVLDFGEKERKSTLFIAVSLIGITLPLLRFDANFHRFVEMGSMFSYVLFSYAWQAKNVPKTQKILVLLPYLMLGLLAAYVYEPFETVVKPLLSYDGFYPLLT